MLSWYCMFQCCSTRICSMEWTMPDALCTSGSVNGRTQQAFGWTDACLRKLPSATNISHNTASLVLSSQAVGKLCQPQCLPTSGKLLPAFNSKKAASERAPLCDLVICRPASSTASLRALMLSLKAACAATCTSTSVLVTQSRSNMSHWTFWMLMMLLCYRIHCTDPYRHCLRFCNAACTK